jgi:zinc transporter ZupT
MIWLILGAATLVMLLSLVGVLFAAGAARRFLEDRLPYLISFSAGVFLVTAGGLALEVLELARSWVWGAVLIAAGYVVAWAIHYLLPETHHHHDPHCHEGHGKSARKLLIGDALHNVADGIILVPAFLVSPVLGGAVTLSIVIHETLQEVAEFFVLRRAGYTTKQALLLNFATASTVFIGVGLAYLALVTTDLEIILLAFSAGFFFHVVVHDLWPQQRHRQAVSGSHVIHGLLLAVGIALMLAIGLLIKDAHVHGTTAKPVSSQIYH